jgi:N-acyl-D-glutamate deacylase
MKIKKVFLVFVLLYMTTISAQQSANKINYDIVILGGRVIDPETKLDAIKNVGILNGKIVAITQQKITGKKIIDAKGLVVAPGFIDLHSHGQSIAADRMQAFDGVTTALELENGILPIGDWYKNQSKSGRVLNYGASASLTFSRISEFEGIKAEADLLWFQKAFSLTKWVNNPATPEQIKNILAQIEQGIKEGSLGIGINAGYAPGSGYKELLAVHALAAKYKIPTFTHISGDYPNDPKSAAESIGQIVSFSAATGSQDHICHLNSSSLHDITTTKEIVLGAQKRGLPITVEAYTYGASSTTIGAALFNEEAREKKNINANQIELNGKPLTEEEFQKTRKESPGAVIVFRFLDMPKEEPVLDESILFPGGAIASDAMPWTDKNTGVPINDIEWPISKNAFSHPRGAGTFTRLLAHWVRERNALPLSEAIAKSSLYPARILEKSVPQMKSKGRIQKGMDADVIIFDPITVQDKATFTEPVQTSVGMKYVLVNGNIIINDGVLDTNARPGKAIRRVTTK